MLYNTRRGPDFEASLWFKNGDHPEDYAKDVEGLENGELRTWSGEHAKQNDWGGQIVRRFRRPDISGEAICPHCGKIYNDHGHLPEGEEYRTPGEELVPNVSLHPKPQGLVCPGDFILTYFTLPHEGDVPVKKYSNLPAKLFMILYEPVRSL